MAEITFPKTFTRIYTCQKLHLAKIIFPQKRVFQNFQLAEITFLENLFF